MLQHVERMPKENPDVDGYSRRTGAQLGLAGHRGEQGRLRGETERLGVNRCRDQ
jgi:hypothetical protein